MIKIRFIPGLILLAVLLVSCSTPATPVKAPALTSSPTMETTIMTPAPPHFRIIAYATDGIIESLIPYDKLTHINYSFLTPKEDGTFNPIVNGWKLKQIIKTARENNVRVLISVGGIMFWALDHDAQGEFSLVNTIYQTARP
ncbi:MAG TPA: hypothetical protein VJ022_10515 [Anaerolineales bacterium]|nr:hypothetical protein [Anaerolineales bacterium]